MTTYGLTCDDTGVIGVPIRGSAASAVAMAAAQGVALGLPVALSAAAEVALALPEIPPLPSEECQ